VPSNLDFSFRNGLKREYNGMFATVISFGLINLASHFFASSRFGLDPLWQVILVAGALLFIVLRTLKKNTRVLDMEGR
jgi:hypothetical protein